MNKIKSLLVAGAASIAFASAAMANCLPSAEAAENLETNYGETLQMSGDIITSEWPEPLDFHLYANEETGTWTFTSVDSETTCYVMDGTSYQEPEMDNGLIAYGFVPYGIARIFADEATGDWTFDISDAVNNPRPSNTNTLSGNGFKEFGAQTPKP